MKHLTIIGLIALVLAVILFVILWPLVLIFALNTLFPLLSIPYGFLTWLAMVVLNLGMFGSIRYNLKQISNKL